MITSNHHHDGVKHQFGEQANDVYLTRQVYDLREDFKLFSILLVNYLQTNLFD